MGGWGDNQGGSGHEDAGHNDVGHGDVGHNDAWHDHDAAGSSAGGHPEGASLHAWEDALAHPHHVSSEHERLDLNDADRLPWLEGDEDDYVATASIGRVIVAGLAALLVVGGVVGGIWWATHREAVNAPVADGSTVTPPSAQYKDAPANPGGKTFQGTGDTSYVVSQGQNRQAQLADGGDNVASGSRSHGADAAPAKAADKSGAVTGNAGASSSASPDAAPAGSVVQIGAFSTKDLAEAGWSHLSSQHSMLAQQHHRILQGQADIGTVWRLQVITGAGGGNALCERLKAEGLSCQVKH